MSTGFSTQDITSMLGLSPARLRAYVRAGLLCPQRGSGGELRFSFQDLLLLRTAEGLVTERLPPRRVRDVLRKLQKNLPDGSPLTGVHLASEGGHVVVRDGERAWNADSGQILFSFDRPAAGDPSRGGPERPSPGVTSLRPVAPADLPAPTGDGPESTSTSPPPTSGDDAGAALQPTADDFYQLGCNLEDGAPDAARVAYERALALDPALADARVNLGRLLHHAGDLAAAEDHYRAALTLRPGDVTALFNLGVLLEDGGHPSGAIAMYEAAIELDPAHADAHFNAARLHDVAGHYEAALRHLRAYRNLTAG